MQTQTGLLTELNGTPCESHCTPIMGESVSLLTLGAETKPAWGDREAN